MKQNALAILRVSSRRQTDGVSHDAQEKEIREYCGREGLELTRIARITESAKDSEKRKHYSAAIHSAIENKIRHVLFYMNDREARNLTDHETNEKLVRADLIEIHYVRDRKIFRKDSSDSDFFMRDVQVVTNKHYSRTLSTKVTDAMRAKAEMGWFPSNQPPVGYKTQPIEGKKRGTTIVIDPAGAKQVLREFQLKAEGYSLPEIRRQVLAEKLVPAKRIPYYRKTTIHRRLKNRFYVGFINWQGEEYPGKHELFILRDLWLRVQATFGEGRRGRRKPPAAEHGIFAGGWLTCAECGCQVVYEAKRKVYRNGTSQHFHLYHCTNGRKVHESLKGLFAREEDLWAQAANVVGSLSVSVEKAALIAAALNKSAESSAALARKNAEKLRTEINSLEVKEDSAYDHFARGILDEETYRRQVRRIRDARIELTERLAKVASDSGRPLETAKSILELAKQARSLWESRTPWERREFLERVLSNPRLSGVRLEFDWKKPFGEFFTLMKSEEWRSRVDDFLTACAG